MTGDREREPMRFTWQILISQLAVVLVLLAAGIGFALALLGSVASREAGEEARSIGRTVANAPGVATAVAERRAGGMLQRYVAALRARSDVLFVVITDDRGIRLAHPSPERIGKPVSTDPSKALAGHEVVNVRQVGTLGASIRSKVPIRAGDRVVGEVSVGFDTSVPGEVLERELGAFLWFAASALVLGLAGAALLTRRLRRQTLGLEPSELAGMVSEREAVLRGIGDGVLAVDTEGRVMAHNTEAGALLDVRLREGEPLRTAALPGRLAEVIAERRETDNLVTIAGSRVLVVKSRPVRRGARELGMVVTMRDRTEVELLTRELDSVRGLSDALRAQRHEFTNRLHTLSGLLQLGEHAEALEYLGTLTDTAAEGGAADPALVADPGLRAILYAKTLAAREKGVTLTLGERSWARGRVTDQLRVTTVLGNLVDNAIRAAADGETEPASVEVDLLSEGGTLHLAVADSGDGIPESVRERLFEEGASTKDGPGHGLGLAIAASSARAKGGSLRLADAEQTLFLAVLPDILTEEVPT